MLFYTSCCAVWLISLFDYKQMSFPRRVNKVFIKYIYLAQYQKGIICFKLPINRNISKMQLMNSFEKYQ